MVVGVLVSGFGQPAEVKWLPVVKTDKDQHTLALLNAGEKGIQLLRWQDRRTDNAGAVTPAMPILTVLTPNGERLYDDPVPGFEAPGRAFRFALANDSVLLVVYESLDSAGAPTLFARRLSLKTRRWSAGEQAVFTSPESRSPAFPLAWHSRSADGRRSCIYHFSNGPVPQLNLVVLDEDFKVVRQQTAILPARGAGRFVLRQVLCTSSGAVLAHCHFFQPGGNAAAGKPYEAAPGTFLANGRPLFRQPDWTDEAPPHANAVFLITAASADPADFYPETGEKYTPSLTLTEGPNGHLYCAGLYADTGNGQSDGYFVYSIDPESKQGSMLSQSAWPASLRKTFLSKRDAEQKKPVPNLMVRWLDWTSDGRPWMLVEEQIFDLAQGRMEKTALLRLDSTYRVNAVRSLEKYQRLKTGDAQNFSSLMTLKAPKNSWWLLWNQGSWPNGRIMLTECRGSSQPTDYAVDASSRSNVSLLPQTLLQRDGVWYFVGESEYHERIRIGMIKVP